MTKLSTCVAVVLLSLFTACSATLLDLPPIASSSNNGGSLPGKIIWHDLLTDTPQQTRTFYSTLFGWQFESVPGGINYEVISYRGQPIGGMVDQNRLPNKVDVSQWVVAMAVADIDLAAQQVREGGGKVLTPPTSLGERGRICVVTDASGALLALLQTAQGDPVDSAEVPPVGTFLWDELWVPDAALAANFYGRLAPFAVEEVALDGVEGPLPYRVLRSQGQPRLGVRVRPDDDIPPMWASYLRVKDDVALEALLAQVDSLGGQVLMPATRRPGGGSVAVILGPSGAGIALQTWPDDKVPGGMGK